MIFGNRSLIGGRAPVLMRSGVRMMAAFGGRPELALRLSPFRRVLHAVGDQRCFARVVAREQRLTLVGCRAAWAALAAGGVAGRTSAGSSRMTARGTSGYFAAKLRDRCAAHRVPHQDRLFELQRFDQTGEILDLNVGRVRGVGGSDRPWPRASNMMMS